MAINLVFYEGIMGSGKTSRMSLDALMFKKKFPNLTLYSNYGLKGSEPFTDFKQFMDIPFNEHTLICLDESHMDLSNRDFSTNSVKFFTNLIFYLRKLNCTIFMTSPLFENLDSKVRAVTNILVRCRKKEGYFIANYYSLDTGELIKSFSVDDSFIKAYASQIYDTYTICIPLEYPIKREDFLIVFTKMKENNERGRTA